MTSLPRGLHTVAEWKQIKNFQIRRSSRGEVKCFSDAESDDDNSQNATQKKGRAPKAKRTHNDRISSRAKSRNTASVKKTKKAPVADSESKRDNAAPGRFKNIPQDQMGGHSKPAAVGENKKKRSRSESISGERKGKVRPNTKKKI